MTGANVAALLEAVAAERPDAPAVYRADGSVAWTTAGLAGAASRGAARLARAGVGRGDTVLLLAAGAAAVPAAAAVLWSGAAILVPARGLGMRDALRAALAQRPSAIVARRALWALALLEPGLLRVPVRFVAGVRGLPRISALEARSRPGSAEEEDDRPTRPRADVAFGDPATVTFTTGSTGRPRPIVRSHGVLRGQHEALDRLRPAQPGDVDLPGLPMLVLHDLARGVPAVLPPAGISTRRSGEAFSASVRRLNVTTAGGFPPLFDALAEVAPPGGYESLRAIHVGGAPVPVDLVRRLRSVAPNAAVTIVYGATEAEPISAIDGEDYAAATLSRSPGDGICVGFPVEGLETRLVPIGQAEHVADHSTDPTPSVGRLQVRGPQVAAGEDADGWCDLGDLARFDSAGRIWLLGRASHAIEDVPPLLIEQAAEAIASVRAAAVMPAGSEGRLPVLAVEVHAMEARRVATEVRRLAAVHRWPALDVVGLRSLPREPRSGKVDPRRLARLVDRSRR